MSTYLCGLDIGGTFTDCVIVDDGGRVTSAKAPSTPGDFAEGLMNALEAAARKCGQPVPALLAETSLVSHGTTVGTNAIVQKRGARVGLITTRGHNDVIHIMRGSRGLDGREVRQVVHIPESRKPTPIVPKRLIRGVSERVDCFGNVVVALNEAQAEEAIRELLAQDVDAIAICFLWSFLEPAHERRVKAMVRDLAPDLFVTCSHELVPKWGEYERTTASCLNAYVGPVTTSYLADIEQRLATAGYRAPLQITQSAGGTIPVDVARRSPLLTLDSGPVAGVMGSKHSAGAMGYENVITTDMGGTSFDIGVIHGGEPAYAFRSKVHQYEYYLPKVDIQAIGSGGGSMVRIDEVTGTLRVGPESAGAEPGPVCYGRGGEVPTVTDADLVLGRLNPDNFAGGAMRLDVEAARRAIGRVADRLDMDVDACASGITQIVEFQMADLIHKATIQKGFDPRDFVLFAFGGAGPAHAGCSQRSSASPRWSSRSGPPRRCGARSGRPRSTSSTSTSGSTSWRRPSTSIGSMLCSSRCAGRPLASSSPTACTRSAIGSATRSTCGTRARSTRSRWGSTRRRSGGTSSSACTSGSPRSTNGSTGAARRSPGRGWRSSPRGAGRRRRRRSRPS